MSTEQKVASIVRNPITHAPEAFDADRLRRLLFEHAIGAIVKSIARDELFVITPVEPELTIKLECPLTKRVLKIIPTPKLELGTSKLSPALFLIVEDDKKQYADGIRVLKVRNFIRQQISTVLART